MHLPLIFLLALGCSGKEPEQPAKTQEKTSAKAEAPKTSSTKEVGLLGIRTTDGRLQTVMVDARGFKTLGEGLAIPRSGGWWWLGFIGQDGWDPLVLWSAPSGTMPAAPPLQVGDCGEMTLTTTVLFASREHVSQELHSGGHCEGAAHPWQSHSLVTTSVDAPSKVLDPPTLTTHGEALELGALAGEAAAKALMEAGAKARSQGECLGEPSSTSWGLVRSQGRWIVRGGLSYEAEACRDRYAHFSVDVDPPAALIADYPALSIPWETLAEKVPGLVDAVTSPSGELAVLVTRDGVKLKSGEKWEAKQLYLKDASIVMALWDDGTQAATWLSEAGKALPGRSRVRGGGGGFGIPGRKPDFVKEGEQAAPPAEGAPVEVEK